MIQAAVKEIFMAKYFLRKLMTIIAVLGTAFTAAIPADAALIQSKNTRVFANWHEDSNDKYYLKNDTEHEAYNACLKQLKKLDKEGGNTDLKFPHKLASSDRGLAVYNLLYANHPELLYWAGRMHWYNAYLIRISVNMAYRKDGKDCTLDPEMVKKAAEAKKNAADVVAANAYKSDYDKIKAYEDYINQNNTYDRDFCIREDADSKSTYYTNEVREIINAFDGDPNTKLICVGYAAAFQYLMDNTVFDDPTIKCKKVGGTAYTGTETGGHDWNIVTIGDNNYLVDCTWDDAGDAGSHRYLLCADDNAHFPDKDSPYTADELKLSKSPYDPSTQIVKAALTFTGTVKAEGTYGSKLSSFTISSADAVTDSDGHTVSGTWSFDPSVNTDRTVDKSNAGQSFRARFIPSSDADKYKALTADVTLTVDKKAITVKAADVEMTAGDVLPAFKLVTPVTGLADMDTTDDLGVSLTADTDGKTPGKYDITGTSSARWYNVTVEKGTLTVKEKPKKKLEFTSAPKIKVTYGNALSDSTVTNARVTESGKTTAVTGSWAPDSSVDSTQIINKASIGKKFKLVFTPSKNADDYEPLTADAALDITKRNITIKADDKTMTEGDTVNSSDLTFKVTDGFLVSGDTDADLGIRLSTEYNAGSDAGSYKITGRSSSQYYNVTVLAGTLTVKEKEKVTPVITEKPVINITYGDKISGSKISGGKASYIKADVPGTFALASSVNTDEIFSAGTHTVKGVFTPDDKKSYKTVPDVDVTVNVSKKPVTVTVDDKTIAEGDKLPAFTMHVSPSLAGNDKVSDLIDIRCGAGDTPAIGTYSITGAVKAGADNYSVTVKNGVLTVKKKELKMLKALAEPEIKTAYGSILSTGKISAVKVTDSTGKTVKGTWTFDSTVNTAITINKSNAGDTFKVKFTPSSYAEDYKELTARASIGLIKKAVTVQADDKTADEGDTVSGPDLTFKITDGSLVSGDTDADLGVKLSTEYKAGSGVGSYQITGNSDSAYYNVTVLPGTLTVKKKDTPVQPYRPDPKPEKTKKDLTVRIVPSATGTYGDRLSSFAVSGGQVTDSDGNTVSGRWTVSDGSRIVNKSNAGNDITLTFTPSDASSYNSTTASIKPAVSKRKITVKADDISRAVGEKRTLTYKITDGTLTSGDTGSDLGVTLQSSDTSDTAGTYYITGSASSRWYDVTVIGGKLTIKGSDGAGASGGDNSGNDNNTDKPSESRPVTYSITYDLNGGTVSGNPSYYTSDTDTFVLRSPERAGYDFAGWTGANGSLPQINVVINKGTSGNLYYVANWLPKNTSGNAGTGNNSNGSGKQTEQTKYYITYDYDGGVAFGNPGDYTENDSFILNNPFKTGYVFTGWTDGNNSTPVMSKMVYKGTKGDIRFTAHWRADVSSDNGSQTVTDDTDDDITDDTADVPDIASKKGKVTKLSSRKKTVTMKFKKVSLSGYKVRYQVAIKRSTASKWNKSFTSSTRKTFKGLKKGTTYWVSVRPYVVVDNTRYFGEWAETKTIKVR